MKKAFFSLIVLSVAGCFGQGSCQPQDLGFDGPATLTLASTDCRLRDATGSSLVPDAKAKVLHVAAQDEGVISISAQSQSFDPAIYFQDPDHKIRAMISGKDRQGNLAIHVPKGDFNIILSATTVSLGDVQVAASFEKPRTCAIKPLQIGDTDTGSFADTPCRDLDLVLYSSKDLPLQLYSLTVPKFSVVIIDMNSSDLDSYVALTTQNGMLGSDDNGAGNLDARLMMSVPPGDYIIRANSQDRRLGNFNLAVKSEDPRPCAPTRIETGAAITKTFNPDGCRYLDLFTPSARTSPVERYEFVNPEKGWIDLNMTGASVQSSLLIYDAAGALQTRQTAIAQGQKAQIVYSMLPGTYTLLATTVGNLNNDFTLSYKLNKLPTCPIGDLAGGPVSGHLSSTSCRVLDLLVPSRDASLADAYKAPGAKPRMLKATMRSNTLDSYLYLLNSNGVDVLENDDSGGGAAGMDAMLNSLVLGGDHLVIATTFDGGPGDYTISMQISDPRNCSSGSIGVTAVKATSFTASDCAGREAIPYFDNDYETNLYSLTVPTKGMLGLKASSPTLPLLAILFNDSYQVIGLGLSSNTGSLEIAPSPMAAGKYSLAIFAPAGRLGAYQATLSFSGDATAPTSHRSTRRWNELTFAPGETTDEVDVPLKKVKRR